MSQKIDVIAHIHAGRGHEALFREVLEGYVAPTRAERGCLRYDLFVDVSDPAQFTFIEEWASREDLDRHSRSAHLADGRARMEGKAAGPAWIQIVQQIAI